MRQLTLCPPLLSLYRPEFLEVFIFCMISWFMKGKTFVIKHSQWDFLKFMSHDGTQISGEYLAKLENVIALLNVKDMTCSQLRKVLRILGRIFGSFPQKSNSIFYTGLTDKGIKEELRKSLKEVLNTLGE